MDLQKELYLNFCKNNNFDDAGKIASINQDNELGKLILIDLCYRCNRTEVIDFTINAFPNIDYNNNINNFLTSCVEKGNINVLKYLLEKFSNVNIHDENERIFRYACVYGQTEIVKYLLEKYPEIIDKYSDITTLYSFDCLFTHLCKSGLYDDVEYFILNFSNKYSDKIIFISFYVACLNGQLEIAKLLKMEYEIDITNIIIDNVSCYDTKEWLKKGCLPQHNKIKFAN